MVFLQFVLFSNLFRVLEMVLSNLGMQSRFLRFVGLVDSRIFSSTTMQGESWQKKNLREDY